MRNQAHALISISLFSILDPPPPKIDLESKTSRESWKVEAGIFLWHMKTADKAQMQPLHVFMSFDWLWLKFPLRSVTFPGQPNHLFSPKGLPANNFFQF